MMAMPVAYGAHLVPDDGGGDELFAGTRDECDSRIRSEVQRGADHCLQCRGDGR